MGQHDENIPFERTVQLIGLETATALRDLTLTIFARAATIAEGRGILLADTKFEFGAAADGTVVLADEVLTPDSSRYWDAEVYAAGNRGASFDKQIVRDWMKAHWDPASECVPPILPGDIVEKTARRYRELVDRLTANATVTPFDTVLTPPAK